MEGGGDSSDMYGAYGAVQGMAPGGVPAGDGAAVPVGIPEGNPAPPAAPPPPLPKEVSQPLSLLAFNKFATDRRAAFKAQQDARPSGEAERAIGLAWKALAQEERQVYLNQAQQDRDRVVATQFGGVEPARPQRKRPAPKAEAVAGEEGAEGGAGGAAEGGAAGATSAMPKLPGKKRGRPPKTAFMAGAGAFPAFPPDAAAYAAANGAAGGAAAAAPAPPPPLPAQASSLVGSRVEGVVDGAFDVGYFLTLVRAIVFRPDLCGAPLVASVPPAMAEDAGAQM